MTREYEDQLVAGAAELGIALDPGQVEQFRRYYALLAEWNQRVNLTAVTEYREVFLRHFLDSLTVALAFPLVDQSGPRPVVPSPSTGEGKGEGDSRHATMFIAARHGSFTTDFAATDLSLLDVGSGAGFPGLPLAIALPELHVTLLESAGKKVAFLREVIGALGLGRATALTARAEEAGREAEHRERHDLVVSRALDELRVLAEYQLPLTRLGGIAVAMKKGDLGGELATAETAVGLLGGAMLPAIPVAVSGLEDGRCLVVIRKVSATSDRYPRRPGFPRKRPL